MSEKYYNLGNLTFTEKEWKQIDAGKIDRVFLEHVSRIPYVSSMFLSFKEVVVYAMLKREKIILMADFNASQQGAAGTLVKHGLAVIKKLADNNKKAVMITRR